MVPLSRLWQLLQQQVCAASEGGRPKPSTLNPNYKPLYPKPKTRTENP